MKRTFFPIVLILIISSSMMFGQRIFRPTDPNAGSYRYGKSPYSGLPFLYFGSTSYQYHLVGSQYNNFISNVDAAFTSWNNAGHVQFSRTTSNGLTLTYQALNYDSYGPAWSYPSWNGSTYELTPSSAYIVLNTSNTTWSNTRQDLTSSPHVLDVQSMVTHEEGHIHGLAHPLTNSYVHDANAPTMAGGDNAYFDNTLDVRSLELEDIYGTNFLQLRVPTLYSTIQSALTEAENIGVGYVFVTSNYTLPDNIVSSVSNMHIIIKSGVTLNLNGKSIVLSNGDITVETGATITGLRARLEASSVLRGLCGRIQAAATYAGSTNEIFLEEGNFNENVYIDNKYNLAIYGNENYTSFGALTVNFCDTFEGHGFRAKNVNANYCRYFNLYGVKVSGTDQSTTGFRFFNTNTYNVTNLTADYLSNGISCWDGTLADIQNSDLYDCLLGLQSFNGSTVSIHNSYFCGTALDLQTYNFSSIHAHSCSYDGGSPSMSGSNIDTIYNQDCSSPKTTGNHLTKINMDNIEDSEFEKINSAYFDINKRLGKAFKDKTDFNKESYCLEYEKIIADYKSFVDKNPDSPLSPTAIVAIAKSCERIDELRGNKDYSSMKNYLQQVIEKKEYTSLLPMAERQMVNYYRLSGDFNSAVKTADDLIEKYGNNKDYICGLLYAKGLMLEYDLNQTDKAVESFSAIVTKYPDNGLVEMAKNQLSILGYDVQKGDKDVTLTDNSQLSITNHPNPFNPSTTIRYNLPKDGKVAIRIFDILGRQVAELVNDYKQAGRYSVIWNGKNSFGSEAASGVYFYNIQYNDQSLTKKMMLIR